MSTGAKILGAGCAVPFLAGCAYVVWQYRSGFYWAFVESGWGWFVPLGIFLLVAISGTDFGGGGRVTYPETETFSVEAAEYPDEAGFIVNTRLGEKGLAGLPGSLGMAYHNKSNIAVLSSNLEKTRRALLDLGLTEVPSSSRNGRHDTYRFQGKG